MQIITDSRVISNFNSMIYVSARITTKCLTIWCGDEADSQRISGPFSCLSKKNLYN